MTKHQGFLLQQRDNVPRSLSIHSGTTQLRTRVSATGIILTVTKGNKDHVTVLTTEEALRLAHLLINEASLDLFGRALT
jgi:hypothetical protein